MLKIGETKPFFPCDNLGVGENGRLTFAGRDTVALSQKYGTPLYLIDEMRVRKNCRTYLQAFNKNFPSGSLPLYASKANSFKQLYRIMQEEGMGIDVVSAGEIYTAKAAGFPMENAFFHGNNKTDEDVNFAMETGVGYFVADNEEEVLCIQAAAEKKNIRQKVLLRLTPGIDTHTYEAVNTGKVDSKFGNAIATGQAEKITLLTLSQKNIELCGFHCHIGSQVFTEDVFERAAAIMLRFMSEMKAKHGIQAKILNLGGGYGVPYVQADGRIDIPAKIAGLAARMRNECAALDMEMPAVCMEPGRSIVADAGLTLYTVGAVKSIPGYKNYVSVDGGMADNPRYALYRSRYTCLIANKINEKTDFTASLVGRCCESGDIIQENVSFPANVCRGDIAAVCTTGAYNYAMSSNYNRLPRPATVMLTENGDYVAVKRESFEDLTKLDI